MNRELIRLEILKVTFRKDRTPEMNIIEAKAIEEYVFADIDEKADEKSPAKKAGRPKAGNSDLLS